MGGREIFKMKVARQKEREKERNTKKKAIEGKWKIVVAHVIELVLARLFVSTQLPCSISTWPFHVQQKEEVSLHGVAK